MFHLKAKKLINDKKNFILFEHDSLFCEECTLLDFNVIKKNLKEKKPLVLTVYAHNILQF